MNLLQGQQTWEKSASIQLVFKHYTRWFLKNLVIELIKEEEAIVNCVYEEIMNENSLIF